MRVSVGSEVVGHWFRISVVSPVLSLSLSSLRTDLSLNLNMNPTEMSALRHNPLPTRLTSIYKHRPALELTTILSIKHPMLL